MRGISGVLDVKQVLQLIVDRVRELVAARYAALGIVDDDGLITDFITSGITDEQRRAIGDLPHGRGLLGLIIRENRPYRIPHIAAHPESYGFPPNHPPMDSFLGVPVTVKGHVVGRLYLTDKQGAAEFSPGDQALIEMFALHAGIAIENARLHEEVQRLAVVDERDRISRDLHDSVIQSIYGVTLSLDDVPELLESSHPDAGRRVDGAIDSLHGVIRDIRNFIFELGPLMLGSGNLVDGLRALAEEVRRSTSVEITVDGAEPEEVRADVVAELLAIAREALSNVARHSGARRAWLAVLTADDVVTLLISDDGHGLPARVAPSPGHHGLANMRARSEALGGTFDLQSDPTAGTRIIVAVPQSGRHRGA